MEAEEAKLKKEGAAAKKVSEKRIATYKEQMEKMEKAKKKSIALGNKVVKAQGALAEAHKKKLAGIDKEYQIKSKQLAAKKKKDEEKFAAEKAKIGGAYRKAMKKNKKAKDDKIAQLKAEAASNKAKAKAEFKKIAATAKAAAAALAKANAKEKKVKDFHAGVEKARRTKEIKEKKDKEAEANNEYKKEAAEAGVKQTKAKAAEAAAEKSNKLSVEEQKNADDLAKAADAKDAAMAECATDGSECQEGNKCKKIDNSKGPYMAADGFSCSEVKQSWVGDEDESGGLAWAGIDQEAAPLEPLKAADPKKCDALTKGATGLFKTAITSKTSCPLLTAACSTKVTFKERRHAMLSVFDWTAACKPWCYPGTATKTADGVQDTWGICLDAADVMQAKEQITDMPSYKASGTGGRFPAGPKGDICKMAKMFVCGFASGANEPLCKDTEEEELIQGSPASIKAAATNAKAQGKAAKAAAQTEAKETKLEAETAKKAKKLAGEQKKLTDAAAKATVKAAKKAEKFKKEMEAEEAKLKKEGAAAKKVSEKRIAAYKEQMEKMEKAKKKSIALGNKIVKAQGALAEAHKKKLAGIDKE